MPPRIVGAEESVVPGTRGGSSRGAESFALCCSSLNRFLEEAVQTAELFLLSSPLWICVRNARILCYILHIFHWY